MPPTAVMRGIGSRGRDGFQQLVGDYSWAQRMGKRTMCTSSTLLKEKRVKSMAETRNTFAFPVGPAWRTDSLLPHATAPTVHFSQERLPSAVDTRRPLPRGASFSFGLSTCFLAFPTGRELSLQRVWMWNISLLWALGTEEKQKTAGEQSAENSNGR